MSSVSPGEIQELIERFEKNIIYNCHSLRAKISRSLARKKLNKIGKNALRPIIKHLKKNTHQMN